MRNPYAKYNPKGYFTWKQGDVNYTLLSLRYSPQRSLEDILSTCRIRISFPDDPEGYEDRMYVNRYPALVAHLKTL